MLYDDEPPPRPRWPLGLAVAGACVLLALGAVGLIALVANLPSRPEATAAAPAGKAADGVRDQAELRQQLMRTDWDGAQRLLGTPRKAEVGRLVFEVPTRAWLLGRTNRYVHVLFRRPPARVMAFEDFNQAAQEAALNPPRVERVEFSDTPD